MTTSKTISATVLGGKQYTVSYWSKSQSITVNANGIPVSVGSSGPAKIGWTYYEYVLPANTTSVSLTTSSAATIDELRLYPYNSQMTTYTYLPLVGMIGQCDVKNVATYYEYDGLLRLRDIKDQDGNIIKIMNYHYQGH
jgi:hypothetical protein